MEVEFKENIERENIIEFIRKNVSRMNRIKAEDVVKLFEDKSLDRLLNNSKYLLDIKGINEKSALKIQECLQVYIGLKRMFESLNELDDKEDIIGAIYKGIGIRAILEVKENPYCICEKCDIDFNIADKIALSLGFKFDNKNRIKELIMVVINNEMQKNGDLFIYENRKLKERLEFIKEVSAFYHNFGDIDFKYINEALNSLCLEGKIFIEEDSNGIKCIYLYDYYIMEKCIVDRVKSCLKEKGFCDSREKVLNHDSLKNYNLSEEQSDAVATVLTNKLTIITGGPGTGKTSVIKVLLAVINAINPNTQVEISAPTGKAAIRVSKVTEHEANTIHRLLNLSYSNKTELKRVQSDFLFIDEASMVDASLFYKLLENTDIKTNIVIIGDHEQLQSIGPGSILRDLINSKQVPVVTLKQLYRQAKKSLIIKNANILVDKEKIDKKEWFQFDDEQFVFIEESKEKIGDKILIIMEHLTCELKYSLEDIMFLSPVKNGELGTNKLNLKLQKWCYGGVSSKSKGIIKNHDRVIQTVNNYQTGVMNGEVGEVISFNESRDSGKKTFNVKFDERNIEYDEGKISQLELGYSITFHKSQGSEYQVIVIPICKQNMYRVNINSIYTAITRAKQKVVLIGDKSAFFEAINKKEENVRNSRIVEKLNS